MWVWDMRYEIWESRENSNTPSCGGRRIYQGSHSEGSAPDWAGDGAVQMKGFLSVKVPVAYPAGVLQTWAHWGFNVPKIPNGLIYFLMICLLLLLSFMVFFVWLWCFLFVCLYKHAQIYFGEYDVGCALRGVLVCYRELILAQLFSFVNACIGSKWTL